MEKEETKFSIHYNKGVAHIVVNESLLYANRKHRRLRFTRYEG